MIAALAVAAGVLVILVTSSPTWIRVSVRTSSRPVELTGSSAAAAVVPLALVAGAGLIAIALVRSWVRRLLAVFIAAAGVGAIVVVIRVIADPNAAARRSSRVSTAGQLVATHLAAPPYLCLLGAALVVSGAAIAVVFSGRWPAPTPRYERIAARAGRPKDAWEALESGEDPTLGGGS